MVGLLLHKPSQMAQYEALGDDPHNFNVKVKHKSLPILTERSLVFIVTCPHSQARVMFQTTNLSNQIVTVTAAALQQSREGIAQTC